jgi:diguanylate cyclase (GGDEF)-like protein
MGVAAYPEHGSTSGELLRAADQALYQAKDNGRDRIVRADGQ